MTRIQALLTCLLVSALLHFAGPLQAASAAWQGAYHFPHGSTGPIAARDGYVYLLNGWTRGDGILTFDARTPDATRFVKGIAGRGYLAGSAFSGKTLYVTTKFSLMVIDISRPAAPRLIRNLLIGFPKMGAASMAVADKRLFLGGMGSGLRTFDISEPSSPVLVANNPEYGNITHISAAGNLLYFTLRGQDAVVATLEGDRMTSRSTLKIRRGGMLIGPALYHATPRKTVIYDLTDPANPVKAEELPGGRILGMPSADRLLISDLDNGLTVFDTTTPLRPAVKRQINLPAGLVPGHAAAWDNLLFLIDPSRFSLRTFDLSGPNARECKEIFILRNEGHVEIAQGRAFFSHTQGRTMQVLIANLGAPDAMDFASALTLSPVEKEAVFTVNDVLKACATKRIGHFLLTGDGLVDIAEPLRPRILRPPTRMAAAIRTENGKAFLAQKDRLTILDVSRLPELPVLGIYQPDEKDTHITDAMPGKGVLYVINRLPKRTRVEALDISDPAHPKRTGSCDVPPAITCALYRNYLYVPLIRPDTRTGGMSILDVSTPEKPTFIKSVPGLVTTACYQIRVHNDALFFTDSMRGIKRADLRDPLNPVLTNTYTGPTEVVSSYTDFEILAGKLYGLRHSRLDVWQLNTQED